jgi:Ca2+-binding RTX toxin-like protein
MPMPEATIAKARMLVFTSTPVRTLYTYFIAPSMPGYALGESTGFSATQNGSPYLFGSALTPDFVDLSTVLGASAAVNASVERIKEAAGVTITPGTDLTAQIVAFGLNLALYESSKSVYGFSPNSSNVSNALEFDIILTPNGQAEIDLAATIAHELLHSVGLRDVNETDYPAEDEHLARYTIMGRAIHPGELRTPTEPQLYDIAALQSLYGRNASTGAGTTGYTNFVETDGPFEDRARIFCIWDASGDDTIDASARSNAALIDLRPGYFSSIGPGVNVGVTAGQTPTLPNPGTLNISIAFGAYIENAIGSTTGDLIIGNLLSNKLAGGGGADVIYGEGRDSIHEAGDGTYDQVTKDNESKTEQAPTGVIEFVTDKTSQIDHLLGGAGNDYLHGGRGNDIIEGGADNDQIIGGGGDDEIWGGDRDSTVQGAADGIDKVDYSASASRISITFNGDSEAPFLTVSGGQGTDTLHSIERITGTAQVDYLYYSGSIPEDYDLTIDFAGGNDDITNGGDSVTGLRIVIGTDNNGTLSDYDGTPSGPGGHINLLNVHSQIIGSAYDDEITDSSSGTKRIDGGAGDDVITIGGDARAMLSGGAGHDILTGGGGSDVLIGGDGDNQLFGGGGTDMLISDSRYDTQDGDVLEGGAGSDLLIARGAGERAILRGGAGNDLIDARAVEGAVTIELAAGDGHDRIERAGYVGPPPTLHGEFDTGSLLWLTGIRFTGFDLADATIYWDVTITDQEYNPGSLVWNYIGVGDLAIVVGDVSIFIKSVLGTFSTFVNHNVFVDNTDFNIFAIPFVSFDDGMLTNNDGRLNIDVVRASVSQYDVAHADYAEGVEESIVDNEGTPGDDELSGGIGDDALSGGDGDDGFRASGGADVIDGGAGGDVLYLFGARLDFLITRDAATGDVTLADQAGTEGRITVKSVEKIYFAADNEEYEIGDLVGFWGTPGDDALVEGNANDNVIHGLAGADLLRGLAGNDFLIGDAGDDVMDGGAGDDAYRVEDSGDLIVEAVAGGQDGVYVAMNLGAYALAAGAEVEILAAIDPGSTAALNLTGNEYDNTLFGSAGANTLIGGGGNDVLAGGAGNDFYRVEEAGDTVFETAGGGADAAYAVVSHALAAGQEVELLSAIDSGSTGTMNLTGNDFGNTLIGTAGANTLIGGGGNDVLAGGLGNDLYRVEDAGDIVLEYGGGGADAVYAVGSYALAAGYEIEVLAAIDPSSTAALHLTGNNHGNTIFGSNGANVIDGKGGGDSLVGYGGADTFAFTTALGGGNVDTIADFAAGTDKIGLDDAIFTAIGGSLGAGAFVAGSAARCQ